MYAMLPVGWRFGDDPTDGLGGPAVDDAGTLYVCRDEDSEDDFPIGDEESLVFKTTISELVAECIESWESCGSTHENHCAASDALAASLRAAADMLDAAKLSPEQRSAIPSPAAYPQSSPLALRS